MLTVRLAEARLVLVTLAGGVHGVASTGRGGISLGFLNGTKWAAAGRDSGRCLSLQIQGLFHFCENKSLVRQKNSDSEEACKTAQCLVHCTFRRMMQEYPVGFFRIKASHYCSFIRD